MSKTNSTRRPTPSAEGLQRLYGRPYFHGVNSGFPKEGYRHGHQDWKPWVELLKALFPNGGRLFDLGCAYGYLIDTARSLGFQAFGLDVSAYALAQEPSLGPFLAQGRLESLPLADSSVKVVCLFDVLEHLTSPLSALAEAVRVLERDGLIAGATPDPIFFKGKEETHCFERPPSFWIDALRGLGLEANFRFSGPAYNFQFLAGFPGAETQRRLSRLGYDHFDGRLDILSTEGALEAKPREGFASLTSDGRELAGPLSSLYLLNSDEYPLRVTGSLEVCSTASASLRVRWNSHVLGEFYPDEKPLGGPLELAPFLLPCGGHHLFLERSPCDAPMTLRSVRLKAERASREDLALSLPFDLYRRYRTCREIAEVLKPRSILDYGGFLGDQDGHLAASRDLLTAEDPATEAPRVVSFDVRQCDLPSHFPDLESGWEIADEAFDMTVSLDVLEHIPEADREAFFRRLDQITRRWIVLAGPFASPAVERAEDLLRKGLMAARRFLAEHKEFGLPPADGVEQFFARGRGYKVLRYPGERLETWLRNQVMTQHYFALDDYSASTLFNRLCNLNFRSEIGEPAYRTYFLICKKPLDPGAADLLEERLCADGTVPEEGDFELANLHERIGQLLERRNQARRDAYFLLHEREKHIALLQKTVADLEEMAQAPLHQIVKRRLRGRP